MTKNDASPQAGIHRLLNNWTLKLLALVLSFLVWVVVVNVNNPTQTVTITGIPIQITNDDVIKNEGSVYRVVGTQRASVRVTQRRSVTSSLSSSDFVAIADFATIFRANQVPVTVTCQNTAVSPSNILLLTPSLEIQMEAIKSKTVDITVITTGEPAEGYMIGDISTTRSSVTVTAPETIVDRLRSATVTVNVSGASQSVNATRELVLRDAYGGDLLEGMNYNSDEIEQTVTVVGATVEILNTSSVTVNAVVRDTARVASGYRYTGCTVRPEKINVSGMRTQLANFSSIEINDERLSVSGATSDVVVEVDLEEYLPDGILLLDSESSTVTVTMKVEALRQRTIQIPAENVTVRNVPDGLEYLFLADTYSMTVSGLSEDIDKLANENFEAYIDLAPYSTPGDYTVSVKVSLPDGFEQVGPATARLRLLQQAADETGEAVTGTAGETDDGSAAEETRTGEAATETDEAMTNRVATEDNLPSDDGGYAETGSNLPSGGGTDEESGLTAGLYVAEAADLPSDGGMT